METGGSAEDLGGGGFETAAGPKRVGFWGIVKLAAKEVLGQFLTLAFWKNLIKRMIKGMAAAAGEAAWTAVGNVCIDVGKNVKRSMGVDPGDVMFSGAPPTTAAGAVFTRQPQPVRTYNTEPNYRPATYPTTASDNGTFPGFPGR